MPFYAEAPPEYSALTDLGHEALPGLPSPQPRVPVPDRATSRSPTGLTDARSSPVSIAEGSSFPANIANVSPSPTRSRATSKGSSGGSVGSIGDGSTALHTSGEGGLEIVTKKFNELCQELHLDRNFDVWPHHSVGFVGSLRVDGKYITCGEPQPSKKAVKKWLASEGLRQIGHISTEVRSAAYNQSEVDEKSAPQNWIGMLQEFLAKTPNHPEPIWKCEGGEHGPFTGTVHFQILTNDGLKHFYHITETTFIKKKEAKFEVARIAILHLVRLGLMTINGKSSREVASTIHHARDSSASPTTTHGHQTYTYKLAQFSAKYQLPPPKYELKALDPNQPSLFSGSAFFPNSFLAGIENFQTGGPFGGVSNVFGKKNAKEQLAKQVLPIVERTVQQKFG